MEPNRNRIHSEPNVVPLCDILLVLLIIFMIITPVLQKGLNARLPEGGGEGPAIVLSLAGDLSLDLNGESLRLDLLEPRLRSIYERRLDRTLFIRAERGVTYRDVVRLVDIAKGAGVENVAMITQS
jgi:biopolymer transport protein TolR